MTDLEAAIADLRRLGPYPGPLPKIDRTILNAVATGQLVPAPEAPPVDPVRDERRALAARYDTSVLVQMLTDRFRSRVEREAILDALSNLRAADAADAKENDHLLAALEAKQ